LSGEYRKFITAQKLYDRLPSLRLTHAGLFTSGGKVHEKPNPLTLKIRGKIKASLLQRERFSRELFHIP
jgi:hypothetical protein